MAAGPSGHDHPGARRDRVGRRRRCGEQVDGRRRRRRLEEEERGGSERDHRGHGARAGRRVCPAGGWDSLRAGIRIRVFDAAEVGRKGPGPAGCAE